MIIYVKQFEKREPIYTLFNIFKRENIEDKIIINVPINKKSRKRKVEKVFEKLSKYLYNNNIKDIVIENELMQNETAKNTLYSNNINIIDGTKLSKQLTYSVVKKIYEYKGKNIETGEITILANDNNEITIQTIKQIAQNVKRLNIISNNIKKFRKLVDYLYKELGILIKLSNNAKTNLKNTDIIVNMDFPEEQLNKLDIPNNEIIVNVPKNINIKSKKFAGINIKNWEIEVPNTYTMEKFDSNIIYEASLYKKPISKIAEQIQNDNVQIKNLIGVNGIINPKEFK